MPTHPMVTRAKAGIFKPLERMNCHVTTTSPLPRSHVHALRDPNWKEAMLDEYNALITNECEFLVPRPANVNVHHLSISVQRIIASLHSEFAMTDLGSLNYFLGISAQRSASGLFINLKSDRCPYDLSKPLPLQGSPGHLTILVDFFFNLDLEYLKIANSERKYIVLITKTKAARCDLKFIKDMIPRLWSLVKVAYDKDAALGISH
ncbi:ribonuclease H-like domain-containing protein [Tanacetum coccineum]